MLVDCTGREAMSGDVHLRVVDRGTVSGTVDVHAGQDPNIFTIRQNLHGRWLGAACGDVKPFR
jgi:hypothetical protein